MTGAGRSTAAKELEDLGYFVVDNLPADPGARRRTPRRRQPRHRPADRGGRRRPLGLVLRLAPGQPPPAGHRAADDAALPRGRPTRCWSAARRPPAVRTRCRAAAGCSTASQREREVDGRPARRRRPAASTPPTSTCTSSRTASPSSSAPPRPRGSRSPSSASASSTASRSTPTWSPTCGSCPTRTGSPSCARRPAATPTSSAYVLSQPGAGTFLDRYLPVLQTVAEGYLREGKRFMQVAIGCTGGKHRSVAMTEEIAGLTAAGRATTCAPRTATSAGSERGARDRAGCGRPRRRPRPGRLAVGAAPAARRPHRRRPDRGRHRRRQRRLVGPAARRVRRAAARRPADGARRAVRRRRLGPHLGRRGPAPVRRRGRDARPRRRQPAHRRRCGSCSATTSAASTGSAGCSAPTAGCCRWRRRRWTSPPRVRGADPADPDAVTVVRGQVEVATTAGQIESVALVPEDPPACPEAVEAILAADWVVLGPGSWFTSVIPHLLVPGLRRALAETAGAARGGAQPRGAGGGDHRLRPRGPPRGAVRARPRPATCTPCWPTPGRWRRSARRSRRRSPTRGARLVVADIAVRGEPRHDPDRLAAAFRRIVDEA